MHRLFVALRPPPPTRALCLSVMDEGLPGWNWQTEDLLHVTLRFIGEVDGRVADDIVTALSAIHAPPIDMSITGVGWFDQRGGGTLFARVGPREQLAALHAKVDRALSGVGLEPEGRAYLPHITLARGRRGAAPPHPWLERHAGLSGVLANVGAFALMESTLSRSGAMYETIENYRLARS
jgi:2'-5' RNA ligase